MKHQRFLRNFLLYRDIQLRYVWIYLGIVSFVALTMISLQTVLISQTETLIEDAEKLSLFKHWYNQVLSVEIFVFVISVVIVSLLTIVLTHRFLGPVKSLINYFEKLKAGDAEAKLYMREHDGLKPLEEYLKSIDIEVREKNSAMKSLKNERGMTVAEVLVATFILSVVIVGFAGTTSIFTNDFKKVQAQSTKSDLSSFLRMNVRDYASFNNSAQMPENTELATCLGGGSASGCTNRAEIPFVYYSSVKTQAKVDSSGKPVLDASGKQVYLAEPLGGPASAGCSKTSSEKSPVYYTTDGRRCSCAELATTCPIQVVTSFVAYCANDTATCTQPASLKLNYAVKVRSDVPNPSKYVFATSNGYFYAPIQEDHDYYLKFNYANSFDIDPGTGAAVINSGVSEYDIRQGKTLQYLPPATMKIYALFSAPEEVATIKLFQYIYPNGCKMTNLGTKDGTADCTPPRPDQFVEVDSQYAFSPTKKMDINLTSGVASKSVVEYKMSVYNTAGTKILDSKYSLRAFYQDDGAVNVEPPAQVVFNCKPDATSNIFTFTASSYNGWKSLSARVWPPQEDGSVDLHGFEKFNWDNPDPQKIQVDPKYFKSGQDYTITISGTTKQDQVRTNIKTFTAKPKPDKVLKILTPSDGSKVRMTSSMAVSVDMNLNCGESPSLATFKILKNSNKNVLMPNLDMTASCKAYESPSTDENRFSCDLSIPCNKWLNVADVSKCADAFSEDTLLDAKASVKDSSGVTTDQQSTPTFTAGTKISVRVDAWSTQRVLFASSIVPNPEVTMGVDVDLSSDLAVGETLDLSFKGATSTTNFRCGANTSSNAVMDGNKCTVQVPWPVNKGDVFKLTATDPTAVSVQTPDTVTILYKDATSLSCGAMAGAPSCSGGKSLKAKYYTVGSYGFWNFDTPEAWDGVDITLTNSTSLLDFFVYELPWDDSPMGGSAAMSFGKGSAATSTDVYTIFLGPSATPTACKSDMSSCPANYFYVSAATFKSKKSTLPSGASFWTYIDKRPASSTYSQGYDNAGRGLMLIRECYCQ